MVLKPWFYRDSMVHNYKYERCTDVQPLLLQRRGLTSLTSDKGKPVFCLILVQFVPENTVRKSINKCITLSSHKTTHSHFIYTYTETINSSEKRIRSVSLFFHRVPYKQTLSWSQRSRSCLNFSDTMFNFMHYLLKKMFLQLAQVTQSQRHVHDSGSELL